MEYLLFCTRILRHCYEDLSNEVFWHFVVVIYYFGNRIDPEIAKANCFCYTFPSTPAAFFLFIMPIGYIFSYFNITSFTRFCRVCFDPILSWGMFQRPPYFSFYVCLQLRSRCTRPNHYRSLKVTEILDGIENPILYRIQGINLYSFAKVRGGIWTRRQANLSIPVEKRKCQSIVN